MKLSIVTINYNNDEGLKKTLDSVAHQTILSLVLKWISEKDNGIYNAMNKGIRMASGDYIQILNSGDCLYAPDVVSRMLEALAQKKYPSILYGNMIRDVAGVKHKSSAKGQSAKVWTMLDFITGTVNHDPTYISREAYQKYGLYDESLKICSDWKWFVNAIVFGGEQPVYVPIDVTLFDVTGISETQLEAREKERHAELEKMLPIGVLRDYDNYTFNIKQVKRLKKYHVWSIVNFVERVLCKLENKGFLK